MDITFKVDYKDFTTAVLLLAADEDMYLKLSFCYDTDLYLMRKSGDKSGMSDQLIDTIASGDKTDLMHLKNYVESKAKELRDIGLEVATRCVVSKAFYDQEKDEDTSVNGITW